MLEAQDVAGQRGAALLFSGLSFALRPGTVLFVTGPNGSGKTTLLRIVAGLTQPARGRLRWDGADVDAFDPALRAATVFIGHAAALKEELTAEENLASLVALHGAKAEADALTGALTDWTLSRQRKLPARVLSQGQRRRIGLARLRLVQRPLWVLDEPTSALDAAGIEALQEQIGTHLARGGMALIATHRELALPAGTSRSLSLG
jgi:heme exporter protein A